jgi:cation:H+ antiporter
MTAAVIEFLVLAAIIVVAGTILTHCADAIAEFTGWGRLLVGSILLAGATSLPELSVDLTAVRIGEPNLAIGDLLGSSLMNLLILAGMDLTRRSNGKMLSRAAAAHALSGMLGLGLVSIVGLGILTASHRPNLAFAGAHVSVWVAAAAYLLGVRMVALDQKIAAQKTAETVPHAAELKPHGQPVKYFAGFAIAAAVVVLTGPRLAHAADQIADLSGLGGSFVGTTFVALSTSLPELAASIAAIRLGAFDLVIGNVFGSNAFNMMLFLPLDMAFPGSLFSVADSAHLVSVLAVVVCTSLVIMGQLYQRESRIRFLEPDAILVIATVGVALFLVYATS